MDRRTSLTEDSARSESGLARPLSAGTIVLDRRQFLRLAAAAGLVAAASTTFGWHVALAQEEPAATAAPPEVPDVVAAMAARLEHDPERIFRFVADEIRYEPYAGILRGANGSLVARAGNSADQALLLAELLRSSGVAVRFVLGSLDDAAVAALMATTVLDVEAAPGRVRRSLLSDDDVARGIEWTVPADLPPEEIAALLDLSGLRDALERDRDELAVRAARHVSAALDTISAALAAAGIELPTPQVSSLPPLERERHVWVQMDDGTGWRDLDPSYGTLLPGAPVTAIAETLDVLPEQLRHRVDFTVIAETLTGGALAQQPILEVSFSADELAYLGLAFGHARTEDLGGFEDIDIIGSGLSGGTSYNAVLAFGPQAAVSQRPISIGGGGGAALVDAFGGGGGEGLVEGETSAEWLDVALTSPGGQRKVARRTIFDRVGVAMRESGVIDPYAIPPAELVDLADGAGSQYLPARAVRAFSVAGATPNLKMLIQELALDEVGAVSLLAGLIDAERAVAGVEVAGSLGSLGYADAPSVTSLVAEPSATGASVGLDVWHRPFGSLGLAGTPPTLPPAMLAGVIPHAVERAVMEDGAVAASEPVASAVGVGAVFEAAAAQSVPTRLLSRSLPADLTFEPQVRELLQRALDGGQLIIVPEHPVDLGGRPRLGWWLIDPVTGAAVDQMDNGGGLGLTEYTVLIAAGGVLLVGLSYLWEAWGRILSPVREPTETLDPIERNWMNDAAERARQQQRMKDAARKAVRFQQY